MFTRKHQPQNKFQNDRNEYINLHVWMENFFKITLMFFVTEGNLLKKFYIPFFYYNYIAIISQCVLRVNFDS